MSIFKELNEAAKDPIVETDIDDVIVGGMGKTGILTEFHRLNEARPSADAFRLYDDQVKTLMANLADAYIKLCKAEAEADGEDPGRVVKSMLSDYKKELPAEFEAAVNKLWN